MASQFKVGPTKFLLGKFARRQLRSFAQISPLIEGRLRLIKVHVKAGVQVNGFARGRKDIIFKPSSCRLL